MTDFSFSLCPCWWNHTLHHYLVISWTLLSWYQFYSISTLLLMLFFNTTVLVLWDSLAGKVLCHESLITWIQVPLNYVKVEDDVWLHKIVLWLPYNHSGTCAQPHTSCTYIDIIIITKKHFLYKVFSSSLFFHEWNIWTVIHHRIWF